MKAGRMSVPWFPRNIAELDACVDRVLNYGSGLDANHPGFTDLEYRRRRNQIASTALKYRYGEPLPKVEYTQDEVETWGTVFRNVTSLYPTHACREHNEGMQLLVEECGFRQDEVPQLETVSSFLKERCGFTLRPTGGFLSPREFLSGLAFRVYHCTQYVRHGAEPSFTPEPDVCHELLGHMPLFANPTFAQFFQEIGLASLGVSDEWLDKLVSLYWFTLKCGLCQENGKMRAYGATLLSSSRELQYCFSSEPEVKPLDVDMVVVQPYPITRMQPVYFLADSFQDAVSQLAAFSADIPRPFTVRYDAITESIDVCDRK